MSIAAWNDIVDNIYSTASEPSLWPDTIQSIARFFDARGGTLLFRREAGEIGVIVSPALSGMVEEYTERWRALDVRAERMFQTISSGQRDVQVDRAMFSDEEAASLPIFRDFLWPHDLGWTMGVSVSPLSNVAVSLNILGDRASRGFDQAAQEQMLALSRHVERALSLSIRLMDAEAERGGLSEVLDRIACGAFLINASRGVQFANRMAETLLGTGLVVSAGRLCTGDKVSQQAFQMQLDAIANGQVGQSGSHAPLIVPNGERGLIVQVLPLHGALDVPAFRTAIAIVLVEDPVRERPFDPAVVRDAFKLTLGEARLATLIGTGAAPAQAAAALGITEATARTVLKRVFNKMGVSRQSEVAALMGKLFMLRQDAGL